MKKKKVISVYAWEVQAGDELVVKKGSIRKFFHVCEMATNDEATYTIVYVDRARNKFVTLKKDVNDTMRIRVEA